MNRTFGLFMLLVLAALVGALHFSALHFSLYWRLSWFDLVTHFLAGVFVGSATLWYIFFVFHHDRAVSMPRRIYLFVSVLGVVFGVGVLWEIFEYVLGIAVSSNRSYALDTALDLIMDLTGALAAVLLCIYTKIYTRVSNLV